MKTLGALVAAAILISYAGVRVSANQAPTPASASTQATVSSAADDQSYTGTIVLLNSRLYILRDERSKVWYHLDDQQMPAKFLGKKVVVTGSIDAGANLIYVRDIEPANS